MQITLRHRDDAAALTRLIRQTTNAKQRDRYRAVQLAIDGKPTESIQHILCRSRGFVQRWCYVYRDHGLEAVTAKSPPGRNTHLPIEHHDVFRQRVLAGPTEDQDICVLHGRDIQHMLEEEFGVRYSLAGVYRLLHCLNLSVLVPRPEHRKSDPEAMGRWVQDAPLLSKKSASPIQTSVLRCGSRMKQGSASKGR